MLNEKVSFMLYSQYMVTGRAERVEQTLRRAKLPFPTPYNLSYSNAVQSTMSAKANQKTNP